MNAIRRQRPTTLDREMMATFAAGTVGLKADVAKMQPGLARKLLEQEIDLREHRLRQWKCNPSGRPEEPCQNVCGILTDRDLKVSRFKSVTRY